MEKIICYTILLIALSLFLSVLAIVVLGKTNLKDFMIRFDGCALTISGTFYKKSKK